MRRVEAVLFVVVSMLAAAHATSATAASDPTVPTTPGTLIEARSVTVHWGDGVTAYVVKYWSQTSPANKPVQVISGMPCVQSPLGTQACDHIEESVFPAETLGKHYFVTVPTSPHAGVVGHVVRIYGNVDGTALSYPAGVKPGTEDRELLVQLALHASSVLRNARQYRRTASVRDPRIEERIIQTEKLATLGQLVAGVVHELNNPLTSITFYSDYLLRKNAGRSSEDDDVEKLRRIAAAGHGIASDRVNIAAENGTLVLRHSLIVG